MNILLQTLILYKWTSHRFLFTTTEECYDTLHSMHCNTTWVYNAQFLVW